MPRRISSGKTGYRVLGDLTASDNTFQSSQDANIVFQPNGTGVTESQTDLLISGNNSLRLEDGDTNYVAMKAASAMASNYTITMPAAVGSSGQTLVASDGSGTLSWSSPVLAVANRTAADNNTYYLAMVDSASSTSGTEDTLSIATGSRLEFVPNPGKLTVNQFVCGNVDINGGAIDGTNIGATTKGTGGFSTVDINGGNIDGTTIGAATSAAGTFTTLSATSITETSSIAYKENVNPITNALDAVLQLAGVTYDRKDGTATNEAGLIAEDVAPVIPNVVTYKDGKPEGINYTKLSAYLIEAVKSLKDEINELKGSK